MPTLRPLLVCLVLALTAAGAALPAASRRPLSSTDIDDIAQLVMLEDTRQLDQAALARILKSPHPDVRRRAVVSLGRIVKDGARELLSTVRTDPDPTIVATAAWASGQQKDSAAVSWLAGLLADEKTPTAIAREAAGALGKIRSPEARAALAAFLTHASTSSALRPVVGEALLAFGRFPLPGDITPILRWTSSPDIEVRWRAAWALFRPKDPAAIPKLLDMSRDASGDVRLWAVRGLIPKSVDDAKLDRAIVSARLRDATRDPDRRVRTEALRALGGYDDDASVTVVVAALDSPDTWMSVSAAEALGAFKSRAEAIVPKLIAAEAPGRPTALRITALTALVALAPTAAVDAAAALMHEPAAAAKSAASQALNRLGAAGRARLEAMTADPATRNLLPPPAGPRTPRVPDPVKPLSEYRALVERWIVPDYNGAAKPHTIWTTPKGEIEIELYPGDAPMGVDNLVHLVESGAIVGTEFTRVVPDFVDQQATIRGASTLRDEANQRGLTRGNLSWASSGLDTGRPGFTLGSTPQPHNEGDFTALGHVVRGLDVVDRIELGDTVTAARIRR